MAFNIPAQTSLAKQVPITPPTPWVRPNDWIAITNTTNEIQFLVNDQGLAAYAMETTFTRSSTGNIYIDWGDGTVDTVTTTALTNTNHQYTVGAGTPCSLGYTTFKIRVYGDIDTTITRAMTFAPTSYNGVVIDPKYSVGLLEAYIGSNTVTDLSYYFYFNQALTLQRYYNFLQYVELPPTYTGTTLLATFFNNTNLGKVSLPTSAPNLTNMTFTFQSCNNLTTIVNFPTDAASTILSLASCFQNCFNLIALPNIPDLPNCTSFNSTFNACTSLSVNNMPSLPKCLDYTSCFSSCVSLLSIRIPTFNTTSGSLNLGSMFNNCSRLQYVNFPSTVVSGSTIAMNGTFSSCVSLVSFNFPNNFNCSSITSTFQNCSNLSSVSNMNQNMPSLSTLGVCFSGCGMLQEISLPTTALSPTGVTMISIFNACTSLSSVTIPSALKLRDCTTMFNNCTNLTSVVLPSSDQSTMTSLASAFSGCSKLTSVTLPTIMPNVTSLSNMFNGCRSLVTGPTFPSSMNSVTTMASIYSGCNSLQSAVLPNQMLLCTNFSSIFSSCFGLRSVTLPTHVSTGVTTFATAFQNCYNLESVTFPTTQGQLNSVTTMNAMFQNCFSLKSINNINIIGNTSQTSVIYIDGTNLGSVVQAYTGSISFTNKFSKFTLNGTTTNRSLLSGLRLLNSGSGQWAGTSPQIDISFTNMGTGSLYQVFQELPTIVSKTINITSATGAAGLTAGQRATASVKGWTITG